MINWWCCNVFVVDFILFCWQNTSTNGQCLEDAKVASFLSSHNAQPSVHNGTGLSSVGHGAKCSTLRQQQAVLRGTSAVNSVTAASVVKTELPTFAVKPLPPVVTTMSSAGTAALQHIGQLPATYGIKNYNGKCWQYTAFYYCTIVCIIAVLAVGQCLSVYQSV